MRIATILLAEDDKDDQDFFFNFLRDRTDIKLLPAVENGEEVLAYLDREDSDLPTAIILDQNMPKMNGLQTLYSLRGNDRYADLLLVVYSTYADDNLINQSIAAGASMVLSKPTTAAGYHELIDRILEYKK